MFPPGSYPWLVKAGGAVIPYTALAGVSDGVVLLNVAAETSHPSTWHQKPRWIPIRNGVSDVAEKQPLGGV